MHSSYIFKIIKKEEDDEDELEEEKEGNLVSLQDTENPSSSQI